MFALARTLLLADAVSPDALAQAILVATREGQSLVRALVDTGAMDAARLAHHLEQGDAPTMHQIAPVISLVEGLPAGMCERLLAVPVRRDPLTGTVDVAVVDGRDPHPVQEMQYWLNAPVRMVRTSLAAMEVALLRLSSGPDRGMRSLAPPIWAAGSHDAGGGAPAGGALPRREADDPIAFIELGPPSIEATPVLPELRDSDRPAPPTVRGPFMAAAPLEPDEPEAPDAAGSTVRGPYLADAQALGKLADDVDALPGAAAIRGATDRDGILEALVGAVRLVARRVGVFALRRDGIVGWTCSPELAERSAFRALRWPPAARTVLRRALLAPGISFVAIPADSVHAALAAIVGPPSPHEVALAPVAVEGRGVAVVLADGLDDPLVATERLQGLVRVAGEALELFVRAREGRRDSTRAP